MSNPRALQNSPEHREVALLIPWYVNATLSDRDRSRVDRHLAECAACRDDLTLEQRIQQRMSVDPAVEYMPATSLNRLRDMIDGKSDGKSRSECCPLHMKVNSMISLSLWPISAIPDLVLRAERAP